MRDYYDNRWHAVSIGPNDYVAMPSAIAGLIRQSSSKAARRANARSGLYNMRQWNPLPRGGHFAPAEERSCAPETTRLLRRPVRCAPR
jgi:hypothetical protein